MYKPDLRQVGFPTFLKAVQWMDSTEPTSWAGNAEDFSRVEENVQEYLENEIWPSVLFDTIWTEVGTILWGMNRCVSPIEQLLFLALYREFRTELNGMIRGDTPFLKPNQHLSDLNYCAISDLGRQLHLPGEIDYEIDLVLFPSTLPVGTSLGVKEIRFYVAIECDGHDYHERTKEQARKDKTKDRELTSKGLLVLHFTGSEIYRDPTECAKQVRNAIDARIDEYVRILESQKPSQDQ